MKLTVVLPRIAVLAIVLTPAASVATSVADGATFDDWRTIAQRDAISPVKPAPGDLVEQRTGANGRPIRVVVLAPRPPAAAGTVFVKPPAQGADADAILAEALQKARSSGAHRLVLAPGVYRLASRTRVVDADAALVLRDLQDFTIEGAGATLLVASAGNGLVISNCQRLRLSGVTIDYDTPTSGSGVVVEKNGEKVIRLDPGAVPGAKLHQVIVRTQEVDRRFFFGRKGVELQNAGGELSAGAAFDKLPPGAPVLLKYHHYQGAAVQVRDANHRHATSDLIFDRVVIHGSTGAGFDIERMGRGLALVNVEIRARPNGPPLSVEYDGVHVTSFGGDLILRDSVIRDQGDDAINLSTVVHRVESAPPGSDEIILSHRTDVIAVGDTLAFFDLSGGYLSQARVREFLPSPQHARVKLDRPAPPLALAYARNLDLLGRRYVISGNRIGPCQCHGILAQTPNGVIEDNVMSGLRFNAVRLLTSLKPWKEGAGPFNIAVLNNQVRDTGGDRNRSVPHAAISVYVQNGTYLTSAPVGADVAIRGNRITNVAQGCIYAEGVRNLSLRDNRCTSRSGERID
ncbi:right-handed parallel beta-helix repeat-containing protein [Phenylobacterium sp. LjRoot219]|uniref:right-handed parallel beta-helix repeat-containing protein n=1 Tax=Phenylobacterium sp. LjRoot219 TaxID=3342283 RepID=UPI003ED01BE9